MAQDRSTSRTPTRYVGRGPQGTITAEEARALLDEHARSGLTLKAFCLARGLGPQRLSWWKTRFAQQTTDRVTPSPAPLVAVDVRPSAPASSVTTFEPFELRLDDTRALRIPSRFDPAALRCLLGVLAEAT